jgi:serine/threonine protein kinase
MTNHTRVGAGDKVYELLDEVYKHEAESLREQEVMKIKVPKGKSKINFTFGSGHFGKLGLARHIKTQKFVAAKAVSGGTLEVAEDNIAKSEQEDQIHSLLSGIPSILPFYDSVHLEAGENGLPVLYEFMGIGGLGNGEELGKLMQHQVDHGELDEDEKEKILVSIANGMLTGLQGMHEKGYFHLDFKPSNMVVTGRGEVNVIDFGCTKKFSPDACQHVTEYCLADWRYFSPQRLQNMLNKEPSVLVGFSAEKSDSWAVGVSLVEIALQQPFWLMIQKVTEMKTMKQTLHFMVKQTPEKIDEIIAAALNEIKPLQELNKSSKYKGNTLWHLIKELLHTEDSKRINCAQGLKHSVFQNTAFKYNSEEEQFLSFAQLQRVQDHWRNGEKVLADNYVGDVERKKGVYCLSWE